MARELGISRAPVREAARLLEQQGLLVAKPRRGFFVRNLDISDIDEIYDLRICVERHAGVLAARNLTPANRDGLRRQLGGAVRDRGTRRPSAPGRGGLQVSPLICEIAGSRRLLRVFDDLASEMRMVIGLVGRLYDDPRVIAATHEPVLAAIEQGFPERIVAHLDYHIGSAWTEVGQLVRQILRFRQPSFDVKMI